MRLELVATAAVVVLGDCTVLDSPALDWAAGPGTGVVEHADTTLSPSTVTVRTDQSADPCGRHGGREAPASGTTPGIAVASGG